MHKNYDKPFPPQNFSNSKIARFTVLKKKIKIFNRQKNYLYSPFVCILCVCVYKCGCVKLFHIESLVFCVQSLISFVHSRLFVVASNYTLVRIYFRTYLLIFYFMCWRVDCVAHRSITFYFHAKVHGPLCLIICPDTHSHCSTLQNLKDKIIEPLTRLTL